MTDTTYFDIRTGRHEVFDPARMLIVFLHLEKTAGTTVSAALRSNLGNTAYAWRGHGQMLETVASGEIASLRMLSGHFPYGVHRLIDRSCLYATMFRDPVDRLESWFYFIQRRRKAQTNNALKVVDINEWLALLRKRRDGIAVNFQAERVLGYRVPNTESGLEAARTHLMRKFAYVCPHSEAFRFLQWAAKPLGITITEEPRAGKPGVNKPKKSEIDPELRAWLETENRVDTGLHRWSIENFARITDAEIG